MIGNPWIDAAHPAWARSEGDIDAVFKADVNTALLRAGIDINALDPEAQQKLYQQLWQNQFLSDLSSDPNMSPADIESGIRRELFDPNNSSDAALLTVGLGLLQSQGKNLTRAQQTYLSVSGSQVPKPFDGNFPITEDHNEGDPGVDYGTPVGTAMYSPFAGTISVEDKGKGDWGKRVMVKLDNGYTFAIGHLTSFSVYNGQRVNPGDLLGLSGGAVGDPSSGITTGPHVELQWISPDGQFLDPHVILDPIFKGTSFASLQMTNAMGSGVSDTAARDRLLGIDPILNERYPGVVSTWKRYFANEPTAQQLLSVVGGSAAGAGAGGAVAGTPAWVLPIATAAAQQYGVPLGLLTALLKQESGFNPNAVSPAGALGIAQFMPGTASGNGVAPMDPNSAIPGAARLLANYRQQFGSWELALAAYNAGPGSVTPGGGIPNIPETQNYVKSIMSMAGDVSGGTGTAPIDLSLVEQRIRGLPSHIPGLAIGLYSDTKSVLDKLMMEGDKSSGFYGFGHASTDGMVKEVIDKGYGTAPLIESWLMEMDIEGKMTPGQYQTLWSLNQSAMSGIYGQSSGADPRMIHQQYNQAQAAGVPVPEAQGVPPQMTDDWKRTHGLTVGNNPSIVSREGANAPGFRE